MHKIILEVALNKISIQGLAHTSNLAIILQKKQAFLWSMSAHTNTQNITNL